MDLFPLHIYVPTSIQMSLKICIQKIVREERVDITIRASIISRTEDTTKFTDDGSITAKLVYAQLTFH